MSTNAGATGRWPALPWDEWQDTCTALHLWSQIVGKYRLAHAPWVNHSWHTTLYLTPRGLTTGPVHEGDRVVSLYLEFCDHALVGPFLAIDAGLGGSWQVASLSPVWAS